MGSVRSLSLLRHFEPPCHQIIVLPPFGSRAGACRHPANSLWEMTFSAWQTPSISASGVPDVRGRQTRVSTVTRDTAWEDVPVKPCSPLRREPALPCQHPPTAYSDLRNSTRSCFSFFLRPRPKSWS